MEEKFKLIPTSSKTANIEPAIILSEKNSRQTTFVAMQVDNSSDSQKNINGKLIYMNKSKDVDYFDITKLSKRDIKTNEYMELQLDTTETFNLAKGLVNIYRTLYGKLTPLKPTEYVKSDENIQIAKQLFENKPEIAEILSQINLENINITLNIENLKRVKNAISDNLDNDKEVSFWQELFKNNSWVLSQLFSAPYVLMEKEGYMGGKSMDNTGGKYVDFVYKNKITNNIALIEIKAPTICVMDKKEYRTNVFSASSELSGSVNQLLAYKDTLYKEFYSRNYVTEDKFEALNFNCFLIVGRIKSIDTNQKKCFELFRNELKAINIICFDELLEKIEAMISIMEDGNNVL